MRVWYAKDVRPHLAQREWADRVMQYQPPVVCIGEHMQYMPVDPLAAPRRLAGVTRVMAEALYTTGGRGVSMDYGDVEAPTYVHAPPPRQFWAVSPAEQHAEKLQEEARRRTSPLATHQQRLRGPALGTLVHQQILDAMRYETAQFDATHPGGLAPEAARYLRKLVLSGRLPLRGEYVVFDTTLGLGTRVDNVAVSPATGAIALVETKTGYKRGAFDVVQRGTRWRPKTPMTQWANFPPTPANLALVQHALTTIMAVRCLGLCEDASYESFVAHICDDGVDVRLLTGEFLGEAGVQLWAYLSALKIEPEEQ